MQKKTINIAVLKNALQNNINKTPSSGLNNANTGDVSQSSGYGMSFFKMENNTGKTHLNLLRGACLAHSGASATVAITPEAFAIAMVEAPARIVESMSAANRLIGRINPHALAAATGLELGFFIDQHTKIPESTHNWVGVRALLWNNEGNIYEVVTSNGGSREIFIKSSKVEMFDGSGEELAAILAAHNRDTIPLSWIQSLGNEVAIIPPSSEATPADIAYNTNKMVRDAKSIPICVAIFEFG